MTQNSAEYLLFKRKIINGEEQDSEIENVPFVINTELLSYFDDNDSLVWSLLVFLISGNNPILTVEEIDNGATAVLKATDENKPLSEEIRELNEKLARDIIVFGEKNKK